MYSSSKLLTVLFAIGAAAQDGPLTLCTEDQCDDCPNAVTTAGTGCNSSEKLDCLGSDPACVVYDRDTVLGGSRDKYKALEQNLRQVYFDVAPLGNPDCRTIIRSPAGTTDPNCGVPIFAGNQGGCYPARVDATFMVQFCCGTGDCGSGGAGVERRDTGLYTTSSAVLRDAAGNVLVPHAVGDVGGDMFETFMEDLGLNSSSMIEARSASGIPVYKIGYGPEGSLEKRDCDNYIPDGAPYTKISSNTIIVSGEICDSTSTVTIMSSNSVSRSTTFSTSVGDPYGIVSASIDFTTEETEEQSYSYMFEPVDGQCGHVTWTAILDCTGGTITGCDGGDQTGEVCTGKRVDPKQLAGRYSFVQTS